MRRLVGAMSERKKRVWKTRKDFERDLLNSYKTCELQPGEIAAPFGVSLFEYQKNLHKISLPKRVTTALYVLDSLIMDAIIWHHSFAMLLWNDEPSPSQALERALMALHMKISQDSIVVRNLIHAGYDSQAKNLLRSIDEHADAVYYLCLKPEAADEFVCTDDEVSSNEFWWKHIRGSRKIIDDAVRKISGIEGSADKFSNFRSAERKFMSTTHHPSYWGATMPFMVPYRSTSVSMYLYGLPSEYSYRTGKLLFYILAELAVCIGVLNKEIGKRITRKDGDLLQKVVRSGCAHLINMLFLIIDNWNAPIFEFSESMKKFLDDLPKDEA